MTVIDWLLESDPSIRWQVMRDLADAPPDEVAAERARVATEGYGAHLLALQRIDGSWGGAAWNRGWDSTMHVLTLLREMGLDPKCDEARSALDRVRVGVRWQGWDGTTWRGPDWIGNPYFEGEVEPCINGQVASSGAYFGQDIRGIIDRLLDEQLPDGGWNCEAVNGSTRSSFNTTICVLEALTRVRSIEWGTIRGDRRSTPRAGVFARAPSLPATIDWRGDRARPQRRLRVDAVRLPDVVALRRAARPRVPAQCRSRARQPDGRCDSAC